MDKTLDVGCSVGCLLAWPQPGLFPAADKAAVPSQFTSGTEVESWDELSAPRCEPVGPERAHPGGTVHWKTSHTTQ